MNTSSANAVIEIIKTIALCIKEAGTIPSGHLYAAVMGHMDLDSYNRIIDRLKSYNMIRVDGNHLITWIAK